MLLSAGIGNSVEVDQLLAIEGLLPYKLSAYVLYAKIDYGAVISPVRDGRKVVAYQMLDAGNGLPTRKSVGVKASKQVKTAVKPTPVKTVVKPMKAVVKPMKTPAKPVVVVAAQVVDIEDDVIVVEKNDRIVDILDEMDTDVTSFEDREFAEDFVKGL